MLISPFFQFLWILAATGYAALAYAIVRKALLHRWASLFVLALNEVLACAVLLAVHKNYATYFALYWWNANFLIPVIRVWLAWDVVRSLPGFEHIPSSLRRWLGFVAIASATACALFTLPPTSGPEELLALCTTRCVTFAWAFTLCACIFSVLAVGFAFSVTGLRVALGQLLRLLSTMIVIWVYTSRYRAAGTLVNEADTVVSFIIACTWCYSMLDCHRQERRLLEEIQQPASS